MVKFSQNKKIAISAIAIFVISFSTMIFFLGGDVKMGGEGGTNVIGAEKENGTATVSKTGFSTDVSGNITVASTEFCKLLNQNCAGLIKQPIYKYVNKEDFSELSEVLGKLASSAQSVDSIGPIRVSADQSKEKLIILSAQSVQEGEGKIIGINFSVKDITDKVEGTDKNVQPDDKADTTKGTGKSWMDDQSDKLLLKLSFHYN